MDTYTVVLTGATEQERRRFMRTVCGDAAGVGAHTRRVGQQGGASAGVGCRSGALVVSDAVVLRLVSVEAGDLADLVAEASGAGCVGCVVLLDSLRPAQLCPAAALVEYVSAELWKPTVVGALWCDDPAALPLAYIGRRVSHGLRAPVLPCAPDSMASARDVLLGLLEESERLAA